MDNIIENATVSQNINVNDTLNNDFVSAEPDAIFLRNLQHKNIELYLLSCGIEICKPCHTFGPGTRDKFLLHFVLSGKGEFMSEGSFYELHENQAFVIYPGQEVYYRADPHNPWTYTWVSFSGALAGRYLSNAGISRFTHILDIPEDSDIPSIIKRMLEAKEINYSNEIKRQGLLLELLASLISYNPVAEDENSDSYALSHVRYTELAVEYIKENYMNSFSVSDIAEALGITRSYLTRCFNVTLDMTLKQYLSYYRLEKACELLKTSKTSVTEAAIAVGYTNSHTFSKAFKSLYGVTPFEWRSRASAYKTFPLKTIQIPDI